MQVISTPGHNYGDSSGKPTKHTVKVLNHSLYVCDIGNLCLFNL